MADTFLTIDSGTNAETEKTPITTSAGTSSAGKIAMTNADGKWDNSLLYDSGEINLTAGEAITGPALCYINGSGNIKNADNTSMAKAAQGFCVNSISNGVVGAYVSGPGLIPGFSSLTVGAKYFLSTVGGITTTPPAAGSGGVYQEVGFALSATELQFCPKEAIQR